MTQWEKRLYDSYVSTGQASDLGNLTDMSSPYYDNLISTHLPKNKDIAILDIACGYGRLLLNLRNHGYKNLKGVDISEEQVALAHELGITEVQLRDLTLFLEEEEELSYDIIFLMDILEHLEKQDVLDLLDRVNALLKNGGKVILHVPNGSGLFGMRVRYGDFTHYAAFTAKSMQQILKATGFKDVKSYEDRPIIHGIKSLFRLFIWHIFTLSPRLLLLAETGSKDHILSQNMLVIAIK